MNFGKIPVEFVPPGMTAEEARRRRKRQMGLSRQDLVTGVGSIVLIILLCGGAGWYYVGRGQAEEVIQQTSTPATTALEPAQITATAAAGLLSYSPESTYKNNSSTPLPSPVAVSAIAAIAQSPLATPFPLLASIAPSPTLTMTAKVAAIEAAPVITTPAPSATPWPYDYQVIGHEIQSSDLYSYVSGWIVEQDGQTPRPARVRLRFPSGQMLYPRPNNNDVANGHYEFLASPGRYWLEVDDGDSPVVQVDIADGERHEISFRSTNSTPLAAPARSSPWHEHKSGRSAPTPAPTAIVLPAEMKYSVFMPLMINAERYKTFLPLFGGDSE